MWSAYLSVWLCCVCSGGTVSVRRYPLMVSSLGSVVCVMVYERSSPSTIKLLPLVSPCGSIMTCNQLRVYLH